MKQLEKEFIGTGEVRGFKFEQIKSNEFAFIYKVLDEFGNCHYEVFKRIENTQFDCVSYPKSKSFGIWAWSYKSEEEAINKYNTICK